MAEETSEEIKKCIDEAERELREKFSELIFDYGDNDGQYFLHNRTSGFNVLLEYARKWQKAKEAEEAGKRQTKNENGMRWFAGYRDGPTMEVGADEASELVDFFGKSYRDEISEAIVEGERKMICHSFYRADFDLRASVIGLALK